MQSASAPKVKWPATLAEIEAAGYTDAKARGECRGPQCGQMITWYLTPANKRMPLSVASPPGVFPERFQPHFTDCPNSARFQRPAPQKSAPVTSVYTAADAEAIHRLKQELVAEAAREGIGPDTDREVKLNWLYKKAIDARLALEKQKKGNSRS